MITDSTKFKLELESDFDEFDPLEDSAETQDAEETDELGATVGSAVDAPAYLETTLAQTDERPAEERTAELLTAMAPRRKVLLGILSSCLETTPVSQVNARVDELQENNFSVYTAANLCALLEKAGAIKRVTADGKPAQDVEAEPEVVVVDGVEYLEAREPVEICWLITDAGRAALEADKPLERLHEVLDQDSAYAVIYKRILNLCAVEGGATTPTINAAVDNDPLVQKPRLYAPHFIDKLEKCDALAWKKAWTITEIGAAGLDLLSDVSDAEAPESLAETSSVAADTNTATPETTASAASNKE